MQVGDHFLPWHAVVQHHRGFIHILDILLDTTPVKAGITVIVIVVVMIMMMMISLLLIALGDHDHRTPYIHPAS